MMDQKADSRVPPKMHYLGYVGGKVGCMSGVC